MQIELEKLSIDFACLDCTVVKTKVPLNEIMETGCPICVDCNKIMESLCAHIELMEEMEE